jgi:hypothetical protein
VAVTPPLPAKLAFERLTLALRAIEKDTEKELNKALRDLGNEVRDKIRGSAASPFLTGRLRKSIRTSVRGKSQVSLYSTLPQAPVWEYGGTIRPRGVPITIPKTNFVTGVVLAEGDDFDERIADKFDEIAHRHGFFG